MQAHARPRRARLRPAPPRSRRRGRRAVHRRAAAGWRGSAGRRRRRSTLALDQRPPDVQREHRVAARRSRRASRNELRVSVSPEPVCAAICVEFVGPERSEPETASTRRSSASVDLVEDAAAGVGPRRDEQADSLVGAAGGSRTRGRVRDAWSSQCASSIPITSVATVDRSRSKPEHGECRPRRAATRRRRVRPAGARRRAPAAADPGVPRASAEDTSTSRSESAVKASCASDSTGRHCSTSKPRSRARRRPSRQSDRLADPRPHR